MSASAADKTRPLVDIEFRPGELPAADAPSALDGAGARTLAGGGERRMSLPGWLALAAAAAVVLLVVVKAAVSFASNAFGQGSVFDLGLLAALVVLAGSIGVMLVRQARSLRKLKSAERAREMASHLARVDSAGSGLRLVAALEALYAGNPLVLGRLRATAAGLQPHHSDRDAIELLEREIFAPMDRAADERIQRAAIRAVVGVSSCPHPSLDALVVVAVSLALVRDLMTIYGLRHSARSLLRVFRHALLTASGAAVMSTVVDLAMRAAHDRLAAAVAGTAGEALVVARRMFALGALAKAEIRPLPMRV